MTATATAGTGDFACSQCGHRQPAMAATCAACGSDTVHDLRLARTRELFDDIELRLRDRREGRIRAAAVVVGMAVVITLWFVPGWWAFRRKAYALPFLADQIGLMVVVAIGATKLLELKFRGKRFPYLETLPPPEG
ncbi:MAG: hypothetical protein H6708_14100 [Kofleriaceae bacterium]|nr:hypothetical protein [Myxococcales bacterium]MCB9561535.1 hypothetical protein [Kofleriaceae bacterium]